MWYNKDESHYRVCDASGEDSHCSDKYILDTSIKDHLHYLGIAFGEVELEGQIVSIQPQSLALADRAVVVGRPDMDKDETVAVGIDAASGEAIVETW